MVVTWNSSAPDDTHSHQSLQQLPHFPTTHAANFKIERTSHNMSTSAQRTANRKNASHSSGPTSASGKATCSLNSLKHGLASSHLIIPGESEEEFNTLLTGLLTHHQPQNITETMLVQDMAKYHWLADRALHLQNNAIALEKDFAIFIRYHNANERAYHRAFAALNALRKTQLAEIGSASKAAEKAAKQAADLTVANAKMRQAQLLAKIIRDSQPPLTAVQMSQQGFRLNPLTGNWEKEVPA